MSYNTEIQSNNTDLKAILDKVNALPEASTGGGSVATLTLTTTFGLVSSYKWATIDKDGNLLYITDVGTYEITTPAFIIAPASSSSLYDPTVVSGNAISLENSAKALYIYGDCTLNIQGER